MTMISRFEIMTTSIRPSTTSMMVVSVRWVGASAERCPDAVKNGFGASWLPKAASTRCTNSTQKWKVNTLSHNQADVQGNCSQRLAKIKLGMVPSLTDLSALFMSALGECPR